MELIRINDVSFDKWRRQIAELLDSSVKLNFKDFDAGKSYGDDRCCIIHEHLKDLSAVVLAAVEQDELYGFIWIHRINRLNKKRLHIAEIAVSSTHQHEGIGSKLLATAEEYACSNGYDEIDLMVTASNKNAVSFYENADFTTERLLMKKHLKGNDPRPKEK